METKSLFIILIIISVVAIGAALWLRGERPERAAPVVETGLAELQIEDIEEGTGDEVKNEDTVRIHYTGTLDDGTVFDSSVERGDPLEYQVGVGMVIKGWEQGIPGMKVGGKRNLIIPSHLAYGEQGRPSIPPNSTLHFEVELVEIIK
ncbi:peptidylprolyl isomerase [bacterium]|nr:peptidylprolyl isomerase [bacterium]|tara:strand:- start:1869 stop:2312 length:444 start_codon:yes stop_codon:yes gene_type:complete